jgi:hypothetical protein
VGTVAASVAAVAAAHSIAASQLTAREAGLNMACNGRRAASLAIKGLAVLQYIDKAPSWRFWSFQPGIGEIFIFSISSIYYGCRRFKKYSISGR